MLLDLPVSRMPRPVRGYALIENVLQIPPRAALHQQPDDLRVAMLGGQGEGAVPLLRRGGGERLPGLREAARRGGDREVQGHAAPLSVAEPGSEAEPERQVRS